MNGMANMGLPTPASLRPRLKSNIVKVGTHPWALASMSMTSQAVANVV